MAGKLSQNLTILLTDIKGFTEKTSHKSRADILTMLENHKEIVLPVLEGKGGRLVKTIGDAFLMVFESPTDAVLAGMAVQEALAVFNKDKKGDDRIDVRIAINTGEVTLSDDDIFGDPVNITARIEGIAEAGEVFFTEAVYLAMNKQEVPSSEVGLLQLKGIPEKVRVYKVVSEEPVEEHPGVKMPVAPLKKGLLDALRPRAPKAVVAGEPPSPDAPKVSMWRRTAALAVDAIIVSILAGMLFGKESANIHVTHRGGERAKKAGIQVNEQGIKIGDSIKIDEKGVKVGDGIQIDEDGVRIGGIGRKLPTLHEAKERLREAQKEAKQAENLAKMAAMHARAEGATEKDVEKAKELLGESAAKSQEALRAQGELNRANMRVTKKRKVQIHGSDEDEEILLEDGPLKVTRRKRKKDKAFPILWIIYSTFFLIYWGVTPGKRLLKLKIVMHDPGAKFEWKNALVRSVFMLVSASVAMIGFIWALFERDNRTWHDLVAGTRVVRAE